LVGAGVLTIKQIFPMTMGANSGTTVTSMLAALAAVANAADPQRAMVAVTVAFYHVLFNILGVAMIWPIRGLPIAMATRFAKLALWNRALPVVYIVIVFYLVPVLFVMFGS